MSLTQERKRDLRRKAHALRAVVIIGQNGLKPTVEQEIELALDHHELIKVKINGAEREERQAIVQSILEKTKADLVQLIGGVATLYRRNPEK